MGTVDTPTPRAIPRLTALEAVLATLLAYVPFLLSSPGRLSGDTKQYLYLDPGQFLTRVPWLWDPQVAAGTVSHQHIGYLFPMGPFYWVLDLLGFPMWVAQRFWLGTISLAAVFGARWLFTRLGVGRLGAAAGALVYVLSPYQLAFTARISVLLLPWAALPWIVGLTMRATRRGGWRDPALIALIILTIGGVNASALLLVGVAPALWILFECGAGRRRAVSALGAAARISVLSGAVSLWWLAGLWAQGSYGLPVLQLTENVRTISAASSPGDVLRGIGNWFFYGYDRSGNSLIQTRAFVRDQLVVVPSFLVPAFALLAGVLARWRYRAFFAACIIVGTIVSVGAWPFTATTPYGRLWKIFTDESSVGLALRNTPRAAPVVVLGVAGLLAVGVGAVTRSRLRVVAAAGVACVVILSMLPVWRDGFLTPGVERPNEIPKYWRNAIAALDHESHATRILEIPGSSFATYRWGNTVEPITPGLTTRPYLAREVLPYGSPESVNLLDAFDRRLQNGSFEPTAIAPIARLFGVGTVSVRSDLDYERSGAPHPQVVWSALADPLAPGLGTPRSFGPRVGPFASALDGIDLRSARAADPPSVSLFSVEHAVPIVRTVPDRDPIVMSGDGDGIVDLASAGLITGAEHILELAGVGRPGLHHALQTGAALALTDTNRRRVSSYFSSIRDTKGATERAGQTTHDVAGYDTHLDPLPDHRDSAHTVVEQHGARVDANVDGGTGRPEDRAARAFDGDLRTAWRVGGPSPDGANITLRPTRPVTADHVDLVQPQELPRDRWVTRARVTINGRTSVTVNLGPRSFTDAGQRVSFARTPVRSLTVQIIQNQLPPSDPNFANAAGFAEIRLGHVRVTETVRLPVDLATRVGRRAAGHSLAVVLTRLRQDTGAQGRQDEELSLDRRFVLPDARTFTVSGTARVDPNAPDPVIDDVLGTVSPGTRFLASSHLTGDADARASRAFTGRSADAWTSAYGTQSGQFVDAVLDHPTTADRIDLSVVADDHHSTPTQIQVLADDKVVATFPVHIPAAAATGKQATRVPLGLAFPATTATRFGLYVVSAAAPPNHPIPAPAAVQPISLTEVAIPGVAPAAHAEALPTACRSDLVTVDGTPRPVRLVGSVADARRGLDVEPCDGAVALGIGSHHLSTPRGGTTGIDIDRLVFSSGPRAQPSRPGLLVNPAPVSGTQVRVSNPARDQVEVTAHTDGAPFWLVLGQSHNRGWSASTAGHSLGAPTLADGYANAWLIRPRHAGTMHISMQWTPQRVVWVAIALSVAALVLCLAILAFTRRRRRATPPTDDDDLVDEPRLRIAPDRGRATVLATVVFVAGTFVTVAAFSRIQIALAAAVVAGVAAVAPRLRPLLGLAAGYVLVTSRIGHRPERAWFALAVFAVAIAVSALPSVDRETVANR